jgi:hypothetical protein
VVVIRRLLLCVLAGACAAPPAASPARAPEPRSTERPGAPPPRYAPSGTSDATLPITSNAYGGFAGAPKAPKLGDVAPDFEAALVDGGTFSLAQARAAGPVLVMFYRGFW